MNSLWYIKKCLMTPCEVPNCIERRSIPTELEHTGCHVKIMQLFIRLCCSPSCCWLVLSQPNLDLLNLNKLIVMHLLSCCQIQKPPPAPTPLPRPPKSLQRTAAWCASRKRERSSCGYRGRRRRSESRGNICHLITSPQHRLTCNLFLFTLDMTVMLLLMSVLHMI